MFWIIKKVDDERLYLSMTGEWDSLDMVKYHSIEERFSVDLPESGAWEKVDNDEI